MPLFAKPSTPRPPTARTRRRTHGRIDARAGASQPVSATVTAVLPGERFAAGGRICRLAASCLAMPEAGDAVLVASHGGSGWIVAVLAARGSRAIRAAAPVLELQAAQCSLRSTHLRTESQDWTATHGEVALAATRLRAVAAAAEGVFGTLSSWARQCLAWRGRSLRQVQDVESLRCGTLDVHAAQLLALGGGTAVLQAQGMLKVDGVQVHVG